MILFKDSMMILLEDSMMILFNNSMMILFRNSMMVFLENSMMNLIKIWFISYGLISKWFMRNFQKNSMMNKNDNSIVNECAVVLVFCTALCGFHKTVYAEYDNNQHNLQKILR